MGKQEPFSRLLLQYKYNLTMKNITLYLKENSSVSLDEVLAQIVDSAQEDPKIYDDTEDWEALDSFDYWEDAMGMQDDIVDMLKNYAEGKRVAGWCSDKSFEEVEKILPEEMLDIMKSCKMETPYKKSGINEMNVWERREGSTYKTVLRFKMNKNNYGKELVDYWYMITIE